MTQQKLICLALEAEGHRKIGESPKRITFLEEGTDTVYYYIGPAGSLRRGRNVASSVPVNDVRKWQLIAAGENIHMSGLLVTGGQL